MESQHQATKPQQSTDGNLLNILSNQMQEQLLNDDSSTQMTASQPMSLNPVIDEPVSHADPPSPIIPVAAEVSESTQADEAVSSTSGSTNEYSPEVMKKYKEMKAKGYLNHYEYMQLYAFSSIREQMNLSDEMRERYCQIMDVNSPEKWESKRQKMVEPALEERRKYKCQFTGPWILPSNTKQRHLEYSDFTKAVFDYPKMKVYDLFMMTDHNRSKIMKRYHKKNAKYVNEYERRKQRGNIQILRMECELKRLSEDERKKRGENFFDDYKKKIEKKIEEMLKLMENEQRQYSGPWYLRKDLEMSDKWATML